MARIRINALARASVTAAEAAARFDSELGSPATFGAALTALRELEAGASIASFARRLGVSAAHLSDVERGHRHVSAERAAEWADKLGRPRELFVRLALQRFVDELGLRVRIEAA
jgi:transcriptional regulator with XRE-family HTH domain